MKKLVLLIALLIAFFCETNAQISIPALNVPLVQDFNTLPTSGSITWIDNSTIPGWYHARTGTGNLLLASDGNTTSGGFYSFGTGTNPERAMGSIGSGNAAVGNIYYGVRLVNNTGTVVTSIAVQYYGEQWRSSAAAAQTVSFAYQTGTNLTSLTAGTWTALTALDFTSPVTGGSAGPLDGNLPANRVLISATISGLAMAAGDEIVLRWYDPDHSGSDHGLSIDDFSASAYGLTGPTSVQFAAGSSSLAENGGSATITVNIGNASPLAATTVEVALISGSATNGVDIVPIYTTQTLTFPMGSSASQSVSIPIFDDALFEGNETATFQLQNVAGGNSAIIGGQATHLLTILDNDLPPDPDVVVNEYYNAGGALSTDEAVELIVYKDGLDMRGFSIADATSGGSFPFGIITFSNDLLWANVQAGTVILIGGTTSVPTVDADPSDGLLKLRAPITGGSNQYLLANSSSFAIAGSSDAVAIRNAASAFIHGLAHGSGNAATLPSGRHGWFSGTLANAQSAIFTRTGAPMVVQDFNANLYTAAGTASLGDPNDLDGNRSFLRTARSRVITVNRTMNGTFFWDIALNGATVTQTGPVNVCNSLTINDGTWDEGGFSLAADGIGNAQNGTGLGNMTIGNGAGTAALVQMKSVFGTITGAKNFTANDATVRYEGTLAQTVLPATYNNIEFSNGSAAQMKIVASGMTVNNNLLINSGAWLSVNTGVEITLGPSGLFTNNGRFLGRIITTRNVATTGVTENFGNIGLSLTPNTATVPGTTTVAMNSGVYLWCGNLPSILKYYTVNAAMSAVGSATLVYKYDDVDLNGQIESNLGLKYSPDAIAWSSMTASLNTSVNTLTHTAAVLNGTWTAHATPPQGSIVAAPATLKFETEQDGPIPASQSLTISNANGSGSIIEWNATSSTVELPTWLSLAPATPSGVNTGTFMVNITRTNLLPNTYTGTITITDPHAVNNPKTVPVTYVVQKKREICVGTDTVWFKASYKKPDPKKSVKVMNCGGNFGPGVIAWGVATSPSWLTAAPPSGLEGQAFVLTASTQGRAIGSYNGSATITGQNSVTGTPIYNSPLTVPVVLEVEPITNFSGGMTGLTAGSTRTLYNSYGQRIAIIKVNSGSISSLTVKMFPFQLPAGTSRLKYAYRYYQFETTAPHYNVDITLFYTSNELTPMNITNPDLLKGYRQYPNGGSWTQYASSANPIMNSVTITGITNLAGNWAMAAPWTPAAPIISQQLRDDETAKGMTSTRKENESRAFPPELVLEQNAPNPISLATVAAATIRFGVPSDCHVRLAVFDIFGRLVRTLVDADVTAGYRSVTVDAHELGNGVYFYRLSTDIDVRILTRRFTITR